MPPALLYSNLVRGNLPASDQRLLFGLALLWTLAQGKANGFDVLRLPNQKARMKQNYIAA